METNEAENSKASSFYDSEDTSEAAVETENTDTSSDTGGDKEDQTAIDKEESQEDKNEDEAKSADEKDELKESDLSLAKDSSLTDKDLKEVFEKAKSLGLTKEQAQEFLKLKEDTQGNTAESIQDQIDEMKDGWKKAIESDPEIGGDKLVESAEQAKRFLTAYGSEELGKFLDASGMANHPELLRAFARAGKAMLDEGKWIEGAGKTAVKQAAHEVFYGGKKE